MHWTANRGPYRKLLPLLITVDEDTLYARDWLRRLVAAQERCVWVGAFRGRQMVLEEREVVPYRDWPVNDERLSHHSMAQRFVELSSQGAALKRGALGQAIGQSLFLSINKRGGNDVLLADCLGYLQEQLGRKVFTESWPKDICIASFLMQ